MKKNIPIFLLIVLISLILPFAVRAETVYTMNPSFLSEMKLKAINLSIKTLDVNSIEIKNNNITRLDVDSKNIAFLINNNNGNAVTYTGTPYLLKLKFENVGSIGEHSIDAIITVNRIAMSDMWVASGKRNPDGTMFFMVKSASIWFGCASTTLDDYVYSADQDIDISVNLVWSGTQTTVEYPFITGIFDLDANKNQANNKTVEKWTAGAGYSKNYFVYETTTLTHTNDTWSNGLENQNTTDQDEYLLTGVYAESNNGAFSSSYREGHSATALKIFATTPNDVNQLEPTKESKVTNASNSTKSKVDSLTDKITYTVTQKLGTMFVDMFTPYSSLSLEDTIPNGLNYQSASVKIKDGNTTTDITNNSTYGSLSYNSATKRLKYTFNTSWLSNRDNYKGQTVTMTINTTVQTIISEYSNTAYTYINSIDMPTNTVVDAALKNKPTYTYVSGTPGKDLPSAISTTSGSYAISDNNEYLVGQSVPRNNSVSVGSKYKVYNNNRLVGTWKLTSWNANSLQMTTAGVEFVGTWEYIAVGEISVVEPDTPNPYDAGLGSDEDEIIGNIPLTVEEIEELENGKDISVYLEVKDITDSISSEEKQKFDEVLEDNQVNALYLDVGLFKKVEGEEATRISKIDEPIEITFEIPEELINTDSKITRTYKLLKLTDDEVVEIEATLDNTTLTFETDEFVNYALVYTDEKIESNPKTGDSIMSYIIMLIVSASIFVSLMFFTNYKKANN